MASQALAARPGPAGPAPLADWSPVLVMAASGSQAHARVSGVRLAGLAASSALMALGAEALVLLAGVLLLVPHLMNSIAAAGVRFASLDDLMRRSILEDLAFELVFGWTILFIAILWRRGGMIDALFNPSAGGRHGK